MGFTLFIIGLTLEIVGVFIDKFNVIVIGLVIGLIGIVFMFNLPVIEYLKLLFEITTQWLNFNSILLGVLWVWV